MKWSGVWSTFIYGKIVGIRGDEDLLLKRMRLHSLHEDDIIDEDGMIKNNQN